MANGQASKKIKIKIKDVIKSGEQNLGCAALLILFMCCWLCKVTPAGRFEKICSKSFAILFSNFINGSFLLASELGKLVA
jgi:hypothetical protein